MAVCRLRTIQLIVCVLQMLVTVQRQIFDFLGYTWLLIILNFTNILVIIFGLFGAAQYITKYIIVYAIWNFIWLIWNVFLICYYMNVGSLNRESGLLSLGTGSVSWWETNGWGCQPVWADLQGPASWRPSRVDGCFLKWYHVELAQSALESLFAAIALPLAICMAFASWKKRKPVADKNTLSRRPAYTIELSPAETAISESSLKPMTPRRVKRRSGSRGANSSVRRSRRSYRNAGYVASSASLPREPRASRPTSAHSSYSNFHAARPASYHTVERERVSPTEGLYDPPPISESVPIVTNRHNSIGRNSVKSGYDVVGPFKESNQRSTESSNVPCGDLTARIDNIARGWDCDSGWQAPPPPAPPYSSHDTPPPAPPYSTSASPPPGPQYEAQAAPLPSPHYGNHGNQPASSQMQYGVHQSPSPAPHYSAHAMPSTHQYDAHSNALYGRPYSHGTPMSPGPPAYQAVNEIYTNMPPCQ